MFKIRGADGREYGPVTSEQLRRWVREGRAGGRTQVQAIGATTWVALNTLPEFAEQFAGPPLASYGATSSMPIVRTMGVAFLVVAGMSVLWIAAMMIPSWRYSRPGNFYVSLAYYFSWGLGILSVPLRIICGIGLLRGREWARRLAVGCAIVLLVYGGWGLARTMSFFAASGNIASALRSPMFLFSQTWSVGVFAFNIATVVLLCRKDVRAAFSRKTPPAA